MTKIMRRDFSSFAAYHDSGVAIKDDIVAVVKENGWIKADLSTECKRWKTAIIEAAESGYWKQSDFYMGDSSVNPYPGYSWEVENLGDDLWYIHLNVKENIA